MDFNAPDINYAGISPIIALTARTRADPARRAVRRQPRAGSVIVVSVVGLGTLAAAAGLLIAQWGAHKNLVAGALRLDDLAIAASLIAIARGRASASRSPGARRRSTGPLGAERPRRVPGAADLLGARDDDDRPGPEPDRLLRRARAALDPALRALRRRRCGARSSLESGLKYLIIGSLGSATLLYGLAFVYGAAGSTDFSGIRDRGRRLDRRRPAAA